jgi:hypothetical protein
LRIEILDYSVLTEGANREERAKTDTGESERKSLELGSLHSQPEA